MKKITALLGVAVCAVLLAGCSAGEVTTEQQKAKKDALQKFADQHKPAGEDHPSRGR